MSVVQNPVTGRTSGKLANIVFSTWKGINVMKAKPMPSNKPASLPQQEQRNKFKTAMRYARLLFVLISWSFSKLAVKKSSFNVWVSENIGFMDPLTLNIVMSDISNLVFSSGSLFGLSETTMVHDNHTAIAITWDPAYMSSSHLSTDKVSTVVYNESSDTFYTQVSGEDYSGGLQTTGVVGQLGDVCHLYAFVNKENFSDVSDSQYLGTLTL